MSDIADPPTVSPPASSTSASLQPWWANYVLAGGVLSVFTVGLVASCFLGNETLMTQMFTAAAVGFGTALGFFFGSSAGSAKKDDTLAAAVAATPKPPGA